MRIFNRHLLLAVATSLFLMGCSDSARDLDRRPEGARLSPREAMQTARGAAERQGMNLRNYKEPEARYQSVRAKTWQVFFDGRVVSPGNHFYIYVDDETQETRFIGGE